MDKKKVKKDEIKGIDTDELLTALDELERQNGIQKDVLFESIKQALVVAYKRNYDSQDENVVIETGKDGKFHLYQTIEIVDKVENEKTQIALKAAKKLDKSAKVGNVLKNEINPKDFGRIAAQTARQVITQRIREMSREIVFKDFEGKVGEIVTGLVQKADGGSVILDLGRIEGVMPKKEQIRNERYNVNDKVKACIINVSKGVKGSTQILLSRTSTKFVKKLFEIEIPEIYEGLIKIMGISRDAGSRSKVAVYSENPNIDPVGSCVGQKGIRIQNIINELGGEKIDVIEYNEDPAKYIAQALLPAEVMAIDIREEAKFAQVIVADNQLSLAIGRGGQNVKLAAKLTQWKIDIKSESQFRKMLEDAENGATAEDIENLNINNEETIDEPVTEIVEEPIEEQSEVQEEVTVIEEPAAEEPTKTKKTTKKAEKVEEKEEKAKKTTTKKAAKEEEEKEEKKTSKKTTTKKTTEKKTATKATAKKTTTKKAEVDKEEKATKKTTTKKTAEKKSTTKKTTTKKATTKKEAK